MRKFFWRKAIINSSTVGFCSPETCTLRLSFTFVATVCHVVTNTSPEWLSAACLSSDSSRSRNPGNSARNVEAVSVRLACLRTVRTKTTLPPHWRRTAPQDARQSESCLIRSGPPIADLPCCETAAARLVVSGDTSSKRLHSLNI